MQALSKSPLFVTALLHIGTSGSKPPELRLAGLVLLAKTLTHASEAASHQYDLQPIREAIVDLVTAAAGDKRPRKQLETCLSALIKLDYPARWPGLLEQVIAKIKEAKQTRELYGALRVIHNIFATFKREIGEARLPLKFLVPQVFPFLENLLLNGMRHPSPDFLPVLNLLMKTLLSVVFIELEDALAPESLKIWLVAVKWVAELSPPAELRPAADWPGMLALEQQPFFKLQKSALEAAERVTQHFNQNWEALAALQPVFVQALPALVDCALAQLNGSALAARSGAPHLHTLTQHALLYKFLYYAVQINFGAQAFLSAQAVELLVFKILAQHLQPGSFERELHAQDAGQYILALHNDRNEPMLRLKMAALDLLAIVCKYEEGFPDRFVRFVQAVFADAQAPPLFREGVLHGLQYTMDYADREVRGRLDELLRGVVLPAAESAEPLLRARALRLLSRLGGAQPVAPELLTRVCAAICAGLQSADLLQQWAGLSAMSALAGEERVQELLRGDLAHVLEQCFLLLQRLSLEEVVEAVRSIIAGFASDVRPFAAQLFTRLLETFWGLAEAAEEGEEGEERPEALEAVESCLNALHQVLCLELAQEDYAALTNSVLEVFCRVFARPQLRALFDPALQLLTALLAHLHALGPDLLFFFPLVAYTVVGVPALPLAVGESELAPAQRELLAAAAGFKAEMHSPELLLGFVGNFVQKGAARLLAQRDLFGQPLYAYVFHLADAFTLRGLQDADDLELICAVRLLAFLPDNCLPELRAHPQLLEEVLRCFARFLAEKRGKSLRKVVLEKLCALMFRDCGLFLALARKLDLTRKLLYELFGSLELFEDAREKEVLLLAVAGLLSLPEGDFPAIVPLASLAAEMVRAVRFLAEADRRSAARPAAEEAGVEGSASEDEDESWDEENYLDEKSFEYKDPLDEIDVVAELRGVLQRMEQQQPAFFLRLFAELKAEDAKALMDCFNHFDKEGK